MPTNKRKIPAPLRKRGGTSAMAASARASRVTNNSKSSAAARKRANKTQKLADKALRSRMKANRSSDPTLISTGKPGPTRTRTGRKKALRKLHTVKKKR